MRKNARIKLSPGGSSSPSCFASISWTLSYRDSSGVDVIKVETDSSHVHYLSVTASRSHSSTDAFLYLHPKLASTLGLRENEMVTIHEIMNPVTNISRANVTCVSSDDWEILESNTEAVVNGLLNQLRVVYPGLKFPFWVSKSLQINLCIESLEPSVEFGILSNNSEIVVPSLSSPGALKPYSLKNAMRLRVHPISIPDALLSTFPACSLLIKNTQNAFVFHESLRNSEEKVEPYFHAQITTLRLSSADETDDETRETAINVKVFLLEFCGISPELLKFFRITNPPCIYLHPELIKHFNMEIKSYVWVKQMQNNIEEGVGKLSLLGVDIKGSDASSELTPFASILDDCQEFVEASLSLGEIAHPFVGVDNGCLLIEGKEGCGKTFLCSSLGERLEGSPYFVNVELLSCVKWKGKKPETVDKELQTILRRAQALQPSLIILDDLDSITPVEMNEQENLQEKFLHFKICETIRECLMVYRGQQISLIATSKSKEMLNPYWKSRQGFHFFHKTVFIPPLKLKERLWIFKKCLNRYISPQQLSPHNENEAFKILMKIHDQYSYPRLISSVARKWAATISLSSSNGESLIGDLEILEKLEKIVDDELRYCDMENDQSGKKSNATVHVKWEDVAGLHQVKAELVKVLQWPIKYTKLFANAPIKLPSGILLYGYPGTGKTLLGLSIPSLVNTKFIHIKGPELLSKFIGASEQAVQDVFKRARMSTPCVIFFDEFDSLVPRRGHDSTGVTDRVVNQFLAEMDGIEGGLGKGVYLVGATSRPDLIDPAVLRPGRLDKHLFFDLPNETERKEILTQLGCKVNLSFSPQNLQHLAEKLDGLSGADINSLACSSQLSAVQQYLENLKLGLKLDATPEKYSNQQFQYPDLTPSDIPVKVEDLMEALTNFRPSLHGKELERYKKIYENFSMGGSSTSEMNDTRQTLA